MCKPKRKNGFQPAISRIEKLRECLFHPFYGGIIFSAFFLIACRSVPVKMSDNNIEKDISQILGIQSDIPLQELRKKESLSVRELYLLALDYSGKMPIEAENLFQAKSRKRQGIGAWLPRATVRATKSFPELNTPGAGNSGAVFPGVRFTARQNIMTGLSEYTGILGADLSAEYAKRNMQFTALQLYLLVAETVFTVRQLEKNIEITGEIKKLTKNSLAEIRRRVALGKNKRGDKLRTESQLARVEAEYQSLQDRLYSARQELMFLTGVNETVRLRDENIKTIIYADAKSALARASSRPDVQLAILNKKLRENDVLAADGAHLPNVYLDGSYRLPAENSGSTPSDFFGAVTAELPLFNGFQTYESQEQARSKLRQAEITLMEVKRRAQQEIESFFFEYENAKAERMAYEKSLRAAEKNYAVQLSEQRLNLANTLDVLTSLTEFQSARSAYENAIWSEYVSKIRLAVATGEIPEFSVLSQESRE